MSLRPHPGACAGRNRPCGPCRLPQRQSLPAPAGYPRHDLPGRRLCPCFPLEGQPGLPPWRLALVTIMQFRENLADRQAAEAVRARIDWKYLLGLALTDPGFSVLSEFRDRLLASSAEELVLEKLLERCRVMGWLKARGAQRTDSTHVLAAIRVLNRLELVAETLRAALNAVATVAPDWLQGFAPLEWYERYGKRIEDVRLPRDKRTGGLCADGGGRWLPLPGGRGGDRGSPGGPGVADPGEPASDMAAPLRSARGRGESGRGGASTACDSRRTVNYHQRPRVLNRRTMPTHATATNVTRPGPATWCMSAKRASHRPPPPHARPHDPATVHEAQCTTPIQQALIDKALPPREHFVDAAYISADLLVHSRDEQGITLRGPTRPSPGWQMQVAGAYTFEQFTVDWERQGALSAGPNLGELGGARRPRGPSLYPSAFQHAGLRHMCAASVMYAREATAGAPSNSTHGRNPRRLHAAQAWYAGEEGQRQYGRRAGVEARSPRGYARLGSAARGIGAPENALAARRDRRGHQYRPYCRVAGPAPRAQTRTSRFAALAPVYVLHPGEAAA